MRRDQLAVNTVSLRGESPEAELRACAEAGFRNVELCLGEVKPWLGQIGTPAFQRFLGDLGLRCIGGFEAPLLAWADEPARRANHDLLAANGELLAELGGGAMVVGSDGPAQPSLGALEQLGAAMAAVAERVPESVCLALEFNWSPLVRSLRSAEVVARAAAHPRVGILFDPAHFHCTPSKLQDLTPACAALVRHVHIDDMLPKPGEYTHCNDDRKLPGEGYLDLPGIVHAVEAGGYDGCYSIEMFGDEMWQLPADEAARRMYDAMVRLCDSC